MSSYRQQGVPETAGEERPRAASALSHRRANSQMSMGSSAGRPLVQEPTSATVRKHVFPTQISVQTVPLPQNTTYRESGQRRKEKEEARSLRDALEEMDLQDEVRIHQAAQDEASELVWMHQHPGVPFKNPMAPYRNPDFDEDGQEIGIKKSTTNSSRGMRSSISSPPRRKSYRSASDSSSGSHDHNVTDGIPGTVTGSPAKKNRVNFALPPEEIPEEENSPSSPRVHGHDSSKYGIFRNPSDQIYEEPEGHDAKPQGPPRSMSIGAFSSALRVKPRNSVLRGARPIPGKPDGTSFTDKLSRFEIHKNPPTQSRNPLYKTNAPGVQVQPDEKQEESNTVSTKDGIEIRSDDIRAATSKRLKDRSSNLPMPSAVSDRPGRPIVSFDPTWKSTEVDPMRDRDIIGSQKPVASVPAPTLPDIQVSEAPSVPVINLPSDKEPTIAEISPPPQDDRKKESRPLPQAIRGAPSKPFASKLPQAASADRWYTPYARPGVPTAKCAACALPIAGKIVTAANARFHPECFTCHHCHTALECVGFYQEPEAKRNERLVDVSSYDEEAHALRFYCHLDFHELFSPRCKSCKTPIEGEIVVACGAEWHVGHFFCAECGDPFNSTTPFVEKEGFAWCLRCHSRRSAPRCLGCKQPVLDEVVISAIGGQWHDKCFVCHECGDGFGPEGRFFVREGQPKRTAKGRIIGGPVQLAVCERCEGIRLKASP
ncbi:hypothetical protein ASPZODRAFT_1465125 [Penicilliopsis zonata CBS 506.65]|uniref:LIM zinc-binding domain-containing protein n=1 Tax=Penicilliopsis zonata CBS 506.65 TaxID=1073090 RepID=A0A1L9SQI8_9EURO|nr:hypothetical protein ASPZODRAFT_1465125 [Penicilliopsis zonata CBS 506.65]OJJ49367.1 hypothetical protein ASPZODRAFT_1465125 [Penicilliopsis zonata CBS 506.65]